MSHGGRTCFQLSQLFERIFDENMPSFSTSDGFGSSCLGGNHFQIGNLGQFGSVFSGFFWVQIQTSASKADFKNNPLLGRNLHKYDSYGT